MLSRFVTAVCTGAGIGAALFGASPLAHANQDPAANPPNCSAADLEGVRAGVSASTSAYLFTHPDLNDFMTSLKSMSREQVAAKVKDRCGAPPSP